MHRMQRSGSSSDIGRRIVALRQRLGLNQSRFGRQVGVDQSTVSRWESGRQMPGPVELSRIARLAGDSIEALLGAAPAVATPPPPAGPAWAPVSRDAAPIAPAWRRDAALDLAAARPLPAAVAKDLPILGEAEGGELGFFLGNGEVLGYADRPPTLAGVRHAYAVVVRGDSMEPRYLEGELLLVNPLRQVRPGDFAVVELAGGQAFIKQFLRRAAGRVVVRQLNPTAEIEFPAGDVKNLHLIVGSLADW